MSKLSLQQTLRQETHLLGSQRMRLAFEVLSAPQAKLQQIVSAAIEENPLLELASDHETAPSNYDESQPKELNFDEPHFDHIEGLGEDFYDILWHSSSSVDLASEKASSDQHDAWIQQLVHTPSFIEGIEGQLLEICEDSELRQEALALAGLVNEHGFLETSLIHASEILGVSLQRLQRAQSLLQSLSPAGFGSEDLRHSLLYQLRMKNLSKSSAYEAVESCWDDLLHGRIRKLSRTLHLTPMAVETSVIRVLQPLERGWSKAQDSLSDDAIDLSFDWSGTSWSITLNHPLADHLSINRVYIEALQSDCAASKAYLKSKLSQCRWLLQALQTREKHLLQVAYEIARRQGAYLRSEGALQPMHLKEVAQSCHLHESTIARVVQDKVASTPRGVIGLRELLNYGLSCKGSLAIDSKISTDEVSEKIREWIALEDPADPLSDEQVRIRLLQEGITCARRTIAKYRNALQLPNSDKRRRYA